MNSDSSNHTLSRNVPGIAAAMSGSLIAFKFQGSLFPLAITTAVDGLNNQHT